MQRILRSLLCLAVLASLSSLVAACGGEDAASQDVDTLLKETFSNGKEVKSGKIALDVKVNVQGGGSGLEGPISVKLGGPFETENETELPKLDLDLVFEGAGQSVRAGVVNTGEKAVITVQNDNYEVSGDTYNQFKTIYKQSAEQAAKQGGGEKQSLQSLGIDPRRWLTNAKNEGESKVGDEDTIKITGGVDIPKLLDDVNSALAKAASLGVQGADQIPTKLTEDQKKQVEKAVENVLVEIYTGADDKILRRMFISLELKDPGGSKQAADFDFDLTMTDLNEDQEFKAPEGTKPFEELLQNIGGLLGGATGSAQDEPGSGSSGSGSSGSGSSGSGSSGSSGSTAAPSTENLEKYTQCVEKAGNDLEKAQQCAELLTK